MTIKPNLIIVPEDSGESINFKGWKIVDLNNLKALHGFNTKAEAQRLVNSMEYFYNINN